MSEMLASECDAVIPPSSFFIFWPGDEPPLLEEIRARLQHWGNPAPVASELSPEDTLWSFWFEIAHQPSCYLIWCEQAIGDHLKLLDRVPWRTLEQERMARSCQWVVGLEGAISLREPTSDYQFQLRLCEELSGDWAPVIYDASALRFRTVQDVRHLLGTRTPPRISSLYSLHKVRSTPQASGESRFWLHTHGLERAGVPDLEIFDVPESLLGSACELIEAVADLWIEFNTPEPQVPFAIGKGLDIAWMPWQAIVSQRGEGQPGGWGHRDPEHGHSGYRAVLVEAPKAGMRRNWGPPMSVLNQLHRTDATLFKTMHETRRMAQLARERWGTFGLLFAGQREPGWRFAVKLCYSQNGRVSSGEHLWFEVDGIRPNWIQGKLLSQPSGEFPLQIGERDWHPLERLSDWRIETPRGIFDPETAEMLLEDSYV